MSVAHRVEESVHGGRERPRTHRVAVDHVDAEFHADSIGRQLPDRACGELVDVTLAREPDVGQLMTRQGSGDGGPGARRSLRLHAVRDRAAVMHPAGTGASTGDGSTTAPSGTGDRVDLDAGGVRQPDRHRPDVVGLGHEHDVRPDRRP